MAKTKRPSCCQLSYRTGYQAGLMKGRRVSRDSTATWFIKNLNRCLDDVDEIVDADTKALILGLLTEHETHFRN